MRVVCADHFPFCVFLFRTVVLLPPPPLKQQLQPKPVLKQSPVARQLLPLLQARPRHQVVARSRCV